MDPKAGVDIGPIESLDRVKSWCIEAVQPYWGEIGFDRQARAFHERLDFTGAPVVSAARRTLVQGRQIYVFAQAAKLGWFREGAELAINAADNMIRRHATVPWPMQRAMLILRPSRSTDLPGAYGIASDPRYRAVADQTFAFLDSHLSSSTFGGLRNNMHLHNRTRHQNPYMHLFEAALAWYEVTGESRYLGRAGEIFGLFTTRFFQPSSSILVEYFDEDWLPVAGSRGRTFEPGHHFEWIWLLHRYARQTGRRVNDYTDALLKTALDTGFVDGVIAAEVQDDATVSNGEFRVWPHAEGIKAAAAEHEAGRGSMSKLADRLLRILESRFMGKPFAAGWFDHFNSDGSIKVDFVRQE